MDLSVGIVEILKAIGLGGVKDGINGIQSWVGDRERRQTRMLIGVIFRVDLFVGRSNGLPEASGEIIPVVLGILDGGVNLQFHIFQETIPKDTSYKRHVFFTSCFPLDNGGNF